MANTMNLSKKFIPMLDEVYQSACLTAVLDGSSELVQQGANANELIIPKMELQGLGDYDRNDGYAKGDVTLTSETVKCNFDRGRMFSVDRMDDQETANIAFGRLAGEFIRTKVAPELDAFRFSSYCKKSGITKVEETLSDGESVLKAIRKAVVQMDEAEVPAEERYLFITPTLHGLLEDMNLDTSKAVLNRFAEVILVPHTRFYTAVKQKTGKDGEEQGGFEKDTSGAELNFMAIHKGAVIQFEKHVSPKVIAPENNPDADAYKFGYRNVGIADVYENKVKGIYASHKSVGG